MLQVLASFSGLSVNDLEAAKVFYSGILGLQISDQKMGLHYELPGGGRLFIYDKTDHQAASFTVLNLVVGDIDAAVKELMAQHVVMERYDNMPMAQDELGVLRGLATNHGPDIAWFKDPAGNIISLIQDS